MIPYVAFGIGFLYLAYLGYESHQLHKIRKSFKHIIHVNGTRGKSTVTRMIGASLREGNDKVWTKVTGTVPMIIDELGQEIPIKRHGNPTIKEQIRIMKKAYKANVDILVVECMAISRPYLYASQHKILRANIGVMTNVRHDHEEVMGHSLAKIADSLSLTIPRHGVLFFHERDNVYFEKASARLNSTCEMVASIDSSDYMIENKRLALKVSAMLCKEASKSSSAIDHMTPDIGQLGTITWNQSTLVNGFSINDADSLWMHYKSLKATYKDTQMVIYINNRSDRPYRAKQHLNLLKHIDPTRIYVAGAYYLLFKWTLKKHQVFPKKSFHFDEELVFGIGNFKHDGEALVTTYVKGGDNAWVK